MTNNIIPITIAFGDGIGVEIMHGILMILREVKAPLRIEIIEIGKDLYRRENNSGISEDSLDNLARTKILLKGPTKKPIKIEYQDFTTSLSRQLSLFANVRHIRSFDNKNFDIILISPNEYYYYYRPTHNNYELIKESTIIDNQRLIRFAFEYARKNNHSKLLYFFERQSNFTILFEEISKSYVEIETEKIECFSILERMQTNDFSGIILVDRSDSITMTDILEKYVGKFNAMSSNFGSSYAIFEPYHGAAIDIEEMNVANPISMIHSVIMMLHYIEKHEYAKLIENAVRNSLKDNIDPNAGTIEFIYSIIERLGNNDEQKFFAKSYYTNIKIDEKQIILDNLQKKLTNVKIYININLSAYELALKINELLLSEFFLESIYENGTKLWPSREQFIAGDNYCCIFSPKKDDNKELNDGEIEITNISNQSIVTLLSILTKNNLEFIKIENIYEFI
jgi:isocitrate dehydrogenase